MSTLLAWLFIVLFVSIGVLIVVLYIVFWIWILKKWFRFLKRLAKKQE